tara:strand:- start:46 stop:429 length:384 start_codon:yes stop_codon:yes gene_type:complete
MSIQVDWTDYKSPKNELDKFNQFVNDVKKGICFQVVTEESGVIPEFSISKKLLPFEYLKDRIIRIFNWEEVELDEVIDYLSSQCSDEEIEYLNRCHKMGSNKNSTKEFFMTCYNRWEKNENKVIPSN